MEILNYKYDVAVIGSGPGGLTSAVAAARQGLKVLLVDRNGHLGGLLTYGMPILGFLDIKKRQVVGGLAEEIVNRLVAAGGSYGIKVCPKHLSQATCQGDYVKLIAIEMCKEAGIDLLLHCETVDVNVNNMSITNVSVQGKGMRFDIQAKIYIDGTGDGDVGYLAGAAYEKGHKGTGGLQPPTVLFSLGNVKIEKLWDYLEAHPEQNEDGTYSIDELRKSKSFVYVGLRYLYEKLSERGECPTQTPALICTSTMNEGQVYINNTRMINTDASDILSLTKAETEGQLQVFELVKMYKKYIPGFEDCYLLNINHTMGVRETRRLLGKKYLTVDKATAYDIPEDSIALAAYPIDIHSPTGKHSTFTILEDPFGIPYLTLVSRDIDNLMMTGRCISVDYEVFGSTRVMATCMAVGEAAGIGAALAVKQGVSPAEVNHNEVRKILLDNKGILKC